jgi:hypothetical protein
MHEIWKIFYTKLYEIIWNEDQVRRCWLDRKTLMCYFSRQNCICDKLSDEKSTHTGMLQRIPAGEKEYKVVCGRWLLRGVTERRTYIRKVTTGPPVTAGEFFDSPRSVL